MQSPDTPNTARLLDLPNGDLRPGQGFIVTDWHGAKRMRPVYQQNMFNSIEIGETPNTLLLDDVCEVIAVDHPMVLARVYGREAKGEIIQLKCTEFSCKIISPTFLDAAIAAYKGKKHADSR